METLVSVPWNTLKCGRQACFFISLQIDIDAQKLLDERKAAWGEKGEREIKLYKIKTGRGRDRVIFLNM